MAFSTATGCRVLPAFRLFHSSPGSYSPGLTIRNFAPKTKRIKTPKSLVAPPGTPIPQNIAVVGGGLAGLAVTYHLLNSTARYARKRGFDSETIRVTIFDPMLPGEGGASAAAAGLLHPFTPRAKKKVWKPARSMDAALQLIDIAQAKTPDRKLVHFPGLLRLALTEKMETDFRQAAHRFPKEIDFLTPDKVRAMCPSAPEDVCAAFIKDAAVVDTGTYLRTLWQICKDSGRVNWRRQEIAGLASLLRDRQAETPTNDAERTGGDESELARFDTIILCAGASIKALAEFHAIPLTPCRGQNLHLEATQTDSELQIPLIAGKYVVPDYFQNETEGGKDISGSGTRPRIIAGATFEYKEPGQPEKVFLQEAGKTDTERATSELEEPLHKLVPDLFKGWQVHGTSSGTRALPPRSDYGSIPIAGKVNGTEQDLSCWIFSGLGSRGLLHHAYLGRMVAHAVVAGNDRLIPIDARRFSIDISNVHE